MTAYDRAIYQIMGEQVPVIAPGWSMGSEHGPGVTILALFGFLGTGLLWRSAGRREGATSGLF